MSRPQGLRQEFEQFRDWTRAELAVVRKLVVVADEDLAPVRANTRLLHALRETQVEQQATLAEHDRMLRQLAEAVAALIHGQAELREDVAQLRTGQRQLWIAVDELRADVAQLKTDVADLKVGMAELLRRLPAPPGG